LISAIVDAGPAQDEIMGRPSAFIRHAQVDGRVVLLDLRTDSYKVLDSVASSMWAALTGERDWATTRRVFAEDYAAPHERLDRDFTAFARTCRSQGLLRQDDDPPVSWPAQDGQVQVAPGRAAGRLLPGTVRAVAAFYETRRRLARDGFAPTYARYAQLPSGPNGVSLARALARFGRAEHFFVARRAPNDCLVRSLSLFRFLCEEGVPAEHVIGVCRMPFQAHAWVECEGRPILDERGHSGAFTPIARIECRSAN
jgi:hypothetical protein